MQRKNSSGTDRTKAPKCLIAECMAVFAFCFIAPYARQLFAYTYASVALGAILYAMSVFVALLDFHIRLSRMQSFNFVSGILRFGYCLSASASCFLLFIVSDTPSVRLGVCQKPVLFLISSCFILLIVLILYDLRKKNGIT